MTQYDGLIEADVIAFIEETERWYPPETASYSIVEQRRIYDQMCAAFRREIPNCVSFKDGTIRTETHEISIRTYVSKEDPPATVLYFHGGGFVVGGLDSHHDVCAEICAQTGFEVVSVDYRLSPEHPFPADFEDAYAAFQQATQTGRPIVLAGDSAGGCLAAALSHETRHQENPPKGQVLIYPGLGGDPEQGSYIEHVNAPMLSREDVLFYHRIRTASDLNLLDDPRCSPLRANDFRGLPPTYLVSAEFDPLKSDSESYYMAMSDAGGEAQWTDEPGLVHGYLRARHTASQAKLSFERIIAAITSLGLNGQLPNHPEPDQTRSRATASS